MKQPGASFEFDAPLDANGMIAVPAGVLAALRKEKNGRVHIRITGRALTDALRAKGVDEAEVDRIASLQMESRGQVLKFLLSEGALRRRWSGAARRPPSRKGITD